MSTTYAKWLSPRQLSLPAIALSLSVMLGSVSLAEMLKPTKHWASHLGEPHYADIVPNAFGDWEVLPDINHMIVDPVQEANLARLYTETLARTYRHKPTGRLVMLSIAYGRDQSTDTQLHTPQQCYPSQGFRVENESEATVKSNHGDLKAVRMATRLGQRVEFLTFFIRVGDSVARGAKERNLIRLGMAMKGYLVDGMLLRVSEVGSSSDRAYPLQDQFISDLLAAVKPTDLPKIIGAAAS